MSPLDTVDQYLDELAQLRRQSSHTVSNYGRDLRLLCALIAETSDIDAFATVRSHHIRRFVAQLHARGLGGRSLARALSAWRGFYRWLGLRGETALNPVEGVRAPKSPKPLPKVLSPDEANRLLDVSPEDAAAFVSKKYATSFLLAARRSGACPGNLAFQNRSTSAAAAW